MIGEAMTVFGCIRRHNLHTYIVVFDAGSSHDLDSPLDTWVRDERLNFDERDKASVMVKCAQEITRDKMKDFMRGERG